MEPGPPAVDAFGLGLAVGADPPGAVAGSPPAVGGDVEGLFAHLQAAFPAAGLGEARSVEEDPAVPAQELVVLLDRGDGAAPAQVGDDPMLVLLQDEAQLLERFHDLDAEGAHARIHAITELARRTHHSVGFPALHTCEGVLHGEVRVLAQAHHHEELVVAGDGCPERPMAQRGACTDSSRR